MYIVDWYDEGLQTKPKDSYSGEWWTCEDKYFNMYTQAINRDYVTKIEEFKYCMIDKLRYFDDLEYLRIYRQYPEAEYFLKAGLYELATKKKLLKQAHINKAFRKWIFRNREKLANGYYYVSSILESYKNGTDIDEIQYMQQKKNELYHYYNFEEIKDKIDDVEKFIKYIDKQDISFYSYVDYIRACEALEIDLSKEKNKYPRDFKRWHDIRTDEYATLRAQQDKKKKKQFVESFKKVANKYSLLEKEGKENYVVIIAKSPKDLIREGKKLHHCVGSMNYDQKFVREESLIFFIRNKEDINKPLVTLEYSLDSHKILQCYADKDSKPSDEILNYVNKKWLPYANKQMKKLVA